MKATEKIQQTAIELRSPKDGAEGPELVLATLVQGLTTPSAQATLQEFQASGELDRFLATLGRWLTAHRSDDCDILAVIELPRDRELPDATILNRVAEGRQLALEGPPDLST